MDTTEPLKLFSLERKLLLDKTLTDGERLRWTLPPAEKSNTAKETKNWQQMAKTIAKFLLFLMLIFVGVFFALLVLVVSGVKKLGVEWVLFALAMVTLITQEFLKWKWTEFLDLQTLKYKYTKKSRSSQKTETKATAMATATATATANPVFSQNYEEEDDVVL